MMGSSKGGFGGTVWHWRSARDIPTEDEGEGIYGMASAFTRNWCNELWWRVAVAVIGSGITEGA